MKNFGLKGAKSKYLCIFNRHSERFSAPGDGEAGWDIPSRGMNARQTSDRWKFPQNKAPKMIVTQIRCI